MIGYPKPVVKFYKNNNLLELGEKYNYSYTRNGQVTLFINGVNDDDASEYEAVATNEYGDARQLNRLNIAEYPRFIQRPEECYVMSRRSGRIEARITGIPYPEIKWFKDWQPITETSRTKVFVLLFCTFLYIQ